jgi:large subunit ribosomal protein L21
MFAIVKAGGHQFRVAQDDVITVNRIAGDAGSTVELGEVIFLNDGDDSTFGAPFIDGAKVVAEIVEHSRGKKVIAFKKRRRQNSKRKRGHRQEETVIRITDILTAGSAPKKRATKAKAKDEAPAEAQATDTATAE